MENGIPGGVEAQLAVLVASTRNTTTRSPYQPFIRVTLDRWRFWSAT